MSTAVALRKEVASALERERPKIEALLPAGVTYERVMSDIFIATRRPGGEKVLECIPDSVVLAVAQIQQWGLQIGYTAHLVPFFDRTAGGLVCTPVADYKGLIELVVGSGVARAVIAHSVYANEDFDLALGSEPRVTHVPMWRGGDRGAIVGAYAVARLAFGNVQICYMRLDEIEAIRAKSKQWSPERVKVAPDWYCVKTVVRRLCKTLPKHQRLAAAMRVMEQDEHVEEAPLAEYTVLDDGAGAGAPASAGAGPEESREEAGHLAMPTPPASRTVTPQDVPPNGLWDERDLPPTRRRDALREG